MENRHPAIPAWANANPLFRLGYKTVRMLKNEGLSQTVFAAKYVTNRWMKLKNLKKAFYLSDEQRKEQESAVFATMPKISIIVPLYKTPEKYLTELLEAVLVQSYRNWQLCLADGSGKQDGNVERICSRYAANEPRIRYRKLSSNLGIAGNTNAAIALADGDYLALLDHDDLIAQGALYEVVRTINETGADFIYSDEATFEKKPSDSRSMHLKPDFSPYYLRGCNYICHLSVVRKSLAEAVGLYNPDFDGSQDYDFTLRVCEQAKKIVHIDKPLYYWRVHAGSVASDISAKPYAYTAAKRAVEGHLLRSGIGGKVLFSRAVPMLRVRYPIPEDTTISILIPTCDHADVLRRCVESIYEKSTYRNFEVILIENNSKQPETFALYEELKERFKTLSVVVWDGPFNFSAINNFGATFAKGNQLLFLNNDTEVITPEWLEEMAMFTVRKDVAAAGVKLLYPDNTIQHGGIAVGVCGSAANLCPLFPREHEGYMSRLAIACEVSACTAACLMVKRSAFDEVGGFEETLAVAFNDVDLCLKLREKGHLVIFNPEAELYHYESRSRGSDKKGEKKARMEREKALLQSRWPSYYLPGGDPYYNRNFGQNSISYDA